MDNINFGIDLGTTNSGIGKYENGKVQVLKNPVGLREILPSVVSFRKGRILVGDKAREQYLTNAENVFSAFKRKIGTNEKYPVSGIDNIGEVSPVDLSAYVLRELQNYVHNSEVDAAVITIPASFDTIQSNATKQAGYQAGFKEVVLLQEPIAACLAYANLSHLNIEDEQKWLVYDFGGGTFDAALVYINHRELKIIDNKGNNFLGGVDIDYAFIKEIIVPKLSAIIKDDGLWAKITHKEGVYAKLWHYLNYLAEEAKKQLSMAASTWIEVNFPELDIDAEFEIDREGFNMVVKPKYQETENFIKELLLDNNLGFTDITRVVLVGGTTYIPFIKDSLKATSKTVVDDSIDPTTAVIVGAAYYAGAHPKTATDDLNAHAAAPQLEIVLSYEAYSNDNEELIAFKTVDAFKGFYRITRIDGGFDSGLLPFKQTASEFVSLIPKTGNRFKLSVFNAKKVIVYNNEDISISQGLYNVSGQLLPEDICIELDNDDTTYLEVIFKRNSILPLKKTLYKTFSKSVVVNAEDKVMINVVEGKGGTMPGANLSIGYIELSGKGISGDLVQGTDVELEVSMDESRGLAVEVFIPSSGQIVKHNFHIASRDVSVAKILYDIDQARFLLDKEKAESEKDEAYEVSAMFKEIEDELLALKAELKNIEGDQVTSEKYRLDERKRKLIAELDGFTRARDVYTVLKEYHAEKRKFIGQKEHANDAQLKDFNKVVNAEKEFLQSNDKNLIGRMGAELIALNNKVALQNPETFAVAFFHLRMYGLSEFNNPERVEELFATGHQLVMDKNYKELRPIVAVLFNQLKNKPTDTDQHIQQLTGSDKISKMGLK